MMEPEDELSKLWALVGDLSEQLANNRALVTQLKSRSDNVRGQAVHVGAGFPLRRFNLDISDEEFHSELEKFASTLVLENQQVQFENKQLNTLLKEYEQTLETVMGKFRGVAHASQQHELALHSYYTSLLQQLQTAHSSSHLHDNTSLSLLLTRLSTLLRSALRSLGGEDSEPDLSALLPTLIPIPNGTNGAGSSGSAEHRSDPSLSPPGSPGGSSRGAPPLSTISRARATPAMPFAGSSHGASGGYSGTEGRSDWAMEREMEITRLEAENKALRELLAIAEEAPEVVQQIEEDERPPLPPPPPVPSGRRKSSLTVQELEASAEREAEERKIAEETGEPYQSPEERRAEEVQHHQQDMEERTGALLQLGSRQETRLGPDGGASLGFGFKFGEEPILEGREPETRHEEAIDDSA